MSRQSTLSQSTKSIARVILIGLAMAILFANLDGTTAQASCPLENTAGEALDVLPSVVLAIAMQALEAVVFDHQWLLQSLFQMLVSFWALFSLVVGAVLLRAAQK
ncbi:MAG TPA: hypothetical protein VGH37_00620 [Candidatus Acidoferrum sp.]|jgi:hypothetical protein